MKKKVIPVLAAIVLIIIVLLFILLGKFIEKYTPSKERMELSEYYGLASEEEVAIIINNEVLDVKGRLIGGNVYLSFQTVHDLLNSRFYLPPPRILSQRKRRAAPTPSQRRRDRSIIRF